MREKKEKKRGCGGVSTNKVMAPRWEETYITYVTHLRLQGIWGEIGERKKNYPKREKEILRLSPGFKGCFPFALDSNRCTFSKSTVSFSVYIFFLSFCSAFSFLSLFWSLTPLRFLSHSSTFFSFSPTYSSFSFSLVQDTSLSESTISILEQEFVNRTDTSRMKRFNWIEIYITVLFKNFHFSEKSFFWADFY